jgi:hypothetical protein
MEQPELWWPIRDVVATKSSIDEQRCYGCFAPDCWRAGRIRCQREVDDLKREIDRLEREKRALVALCRSMDDDEGGK